MKLFINYYTLSDNFFVYPNLALTNEYPKIIKK